MYRMLIVTLVATILGAGCEGCHDSSSGWALHESAPIPSIPHGTPMVEGATPDACEASRQFIASLGVVDEATIARRPVGEVLEIHEDVGADGVVERCWVRLYDEKGRQVLTTQDTYDPPGPDHIHWVLEFDERHDEPTRYRSDSDGDGVFDREVRIEFDARGLIVKTATDEGIDGVVERVAWFFYDDQNHRTRQEFDNEGDGVVDKYDDFRTDESGRITHWDADWDADGVIDSRMIWTFEGRENIEFWEEKLNPTTGARDALRVVTTLDASGRPLETLTDQGDDGSIEASQSFERISSFTTTRWDFENDGVVDNTEVVEWADPEAWPARPLIITDDYGNDGVLDQIRRFTYDSEDRQTTFEWLDPDTKEARHRQTTIRGR